MDKLIEAFNQFREEAELFFVTKLKVTDKLKAEYQFGLDVLLNLTKKTDKTKGLLARSKDYGQGKSFFFDVVFHRVKRKSNINLFKKTSSNELCEIFTQTKKGTDPVEELNKFIRVKNLYIDDIGEELKDGKERTNYGNKINVIRHVLLERYRLWLEKGYKTHGNTNLTDAQLRANYGDRVFDRLQQMVYIRDFTFYEGYSFRRIKDSRRLTPDEIRNNHLKIEEQNKKEREKIDLNAYFNSMLEESIDNLENQGQYFWNFCCNFLKQKGILTNEDFNVIDDKMKESARLMIHQDIRGYLKTTLAKAPPGVYTSRYEEAKSNIGTEQVIQKCESIVAKRRFLELKKMNHKFE